jgi:hypothetical protein
MIPREIERALPSVSARDPSLECQRRASKEQQPKKMRQTHPYRGIPVRLYEL